MKPLARLALVVLYPARIYAFYTEGRRGTN